MSNIQCMYAMCALVHQMVVCDLMTRVRSWVYMRFVMVLVEMCVIY